MSERLNARHCPTCGSLGIMRVPAAPADEQPLVEPVMVCPSCACEFIARGMTFHNFGRPPIDEGDEALEAWCEAVIDQWLGPI